MITAGINNGTYTIRRNTAIKPIRYGITAFAITSIGLPVMPDATKRLMATGGVIIPIAIPTTKRMPKWIRSTPIPCTSGNKTGVKIIIADDVSINTPAMMITRATINIRIYLLVETPKIAFAMASGMP